jgi:hypothetical protein
VFPSLGAHLAHLLVQKEKEKKVLQFGAVLPQFIESCANAGSTSSDNLHKKLNSMHCCEKEKIEQPQELMN